MAVYIDPLVPYGGSKQFRWKQSCHMWADTEQELHAFAKQIGLKREWFQTETRLPHYDLNPTRRLRAVEKGAQQVTWRELWAAMRRHRATTLLATLVLRLCETPPILAEALSQMSEEMFWEMYFVQDEPRENVAYIEKMLATGEDPRWLAGSDLGMPAELQVKLVEVLLWRQTQLCTKQENTV
jgi:hypothetical protein